MEQFVQWFDLKDVSASPSRMDSKKTHVDKRRTHQSRRQPTSSRLGRPALGKTRHQRSGSLKLADVIALVKDRAQDLNALATECAYFYAKATPADADVAKHWDDEAPARMHRFAAKLAALPEGDWTAEGIHGAVCPVLRSRRHQNGQTRHAAAPCRVRHRQNAERGRGVSLAGTRRKC